MTQRSGPRLAQAKNEAFAESLGERTEFLEGSLSMLTPGKKRSGGRNR
jgi:hypothetical protein